VPHPNDHRLLRPTTTAPFVVLAVVCLVVSSQAAWAQGPVPPGMSAPRDAIHGGGDQEEPRVRVLESDKAGQKPVRIRVLRQQRAERDAAFEPVGAGVPVKLQWRARERQRRLAIEVVTETDDHGWADFGPVTMLKDTRRFELRATVREGGVPHMSEPLVTTAPRVTGQIRMLQVTGDPSNVIVSMMMTTLQIPQGMNQHPRAYGFVQVRQVIRFTTRDWLIYDTQNATQADHMRDGVVFEVPVKASSVQAQVMGGNGETEVSDSTIKFKGSVFPEGESFPNTQMMIVFFMKADGSTLEYEQPMTRPVSDVRLAVIRDTDLPEHPVLDIELEAPQFGEISDEAQEGVLEGQNVVVARSLTLAEGDSLTFTVGGLPYPDDWIPYYVGALVLLLIMGGVWVGVREVNRAKERESAIERGDEEAIEAFEEQIEALYAGLAELERDLELGEIDERDYDTEHARLKTRIAVLVARRDEMAGEAAG